MKEQLKLSQMKEASQGSSKTMSEDAIRKRQLREQKKAGKETPDAPPPAPPPALYNIMIPAESSTLSWFDPDSARYETIAAAKEAGIWTYPSNLTERAKCGVFRGLWEQGYFMGSGIKFGGDYLVYPGQAFCLSASLSSR